MLGTQPDLSSYDPDMLLMHAFVLRANGFPNAALGKYLSLIEDHPSEEALVSAAELHIEVGEPCAAYHLLQQERPQFMDSLPIAFAIAEACLAMERPKEAIGALRDILEQEPASMPALIKLGSVLCEAGDPQSAKHAWETAMAASHDKKPYALRAALLFGHFGHSRVAKEFLARAEDFSPNDPEVAYFRTAIRHEAIPPRADPEYLRPMFDSFAASYDSTLKSLENAGPAMVGQMMDRLGLPKDKHLVILDGGCGTGLCGPILHPFAQRLVGIDLSIEMLRQAQNRGSYHETRCGDLLDPDLLAGEQYDLIVSSDVLVYFGPLDSVFSVFARALHSGGHLIITLEALPNDDETPFRLRSSGRYQHRLSYVEEVLHANGFEAKCQAQCPVLRREYNTRVEGYAVAAARGPRKTDLREGITQ